MHLASVPSEKYHVVGECIRQDFIDLSASLEKKVFEFFQGDIRKLQLDSLDKYHKYKKPQTEKRLNATVLLRDWKHIETEVRGS